MLKPRLHDLARHKLFWQNIYGKILTIDASQLSTILVLTINHKVNTMAADALDPLCHQVISHHGTEYTVITVLTLYVQNFSEGT